MQIRLCYSSFFKREAHKLVGAVGTVYRLTVTRDFALKEAQYVWHATPGCLVFDPARWVPDFKRAFTVLGPGALHVTCKLPSGETISTQTVTLAPLAPGDGSV